MLIRRRHLLAAAGASTLAAPALIGRAQAQADQPRRRQLRHARGDPGRVRQAHRHHAAALRQPLDPGPRRSPAHRAGRLRAARRAVRRLCQQREAAAADRHLAAAQLVEAASAAEGRPGHADGAARASAPIPAA